MTANRKYQITCYIPKSLHSEIRTLANTRATTAQDVIRHALENNLEDVINSYRIHPTPKRQIQNPVQPGENEEKVQLTTQLTRDLKEKIQLAVVEHQTTVTKVMTAVLEKDLRPAKQTDSTQEEVRPVNPTNWLDPHPTPHTQDENQDENQFDYDELNWAKQLRGTWHINRTEHINPNVQEDELIKVEQILNGLQRNGKILKPLLWPTFTCRSCHATRETLRHMRSATSQSAICAACFDRGKRLTTTSQGRAFAKTILLDINDQDKREHLIGDPNRPTGAWILDMQTGTRTWPPNTDTDRPQQKMPLHLGEDVQHAVPLNSINANPTPGQELEADKEKEQYETGQEEAVIQSGNELNSQTITKKTSEFTERTGAEPSEQIKSEPYIISENPGEHHSPTQTPNDFPHVVKFATESAEIPKNVRAMVILISKYADHKGKTSISVSTLSQILGIGSKNTIEKWINLAADVGILRKEPSRGGNNRRPNTYLFLGEERHWLPLPTGKQETNPLIALAQARRDNEKLQNRIHRLENHDASTAKTPTSSTSKDLERTNPKSQETFEKEHSEMPPNEKTPLPQKEFNRFMHKLYMDRLDIHTDSINEAIDQSNPELIKEQLAKVLDLVNSWSTT